MRVWAAVAAGLATMMAVPTAMAGIYSDEATKCVVSQITPAEKEDFMLWMFSALALHPSVQRYARITAQQREDITRRTALAFQRLITNACREEIVAALKYEGPNGLQGPFETLGQVATRELMINSEVAKGITALDKYADKQKLEEMAKEAGVTPQ